MRKKHNHSALLKYMHMLEDGYSINYIHCRYGIGHSQLEKLWILYQKEGAKVLCRQEYTRSDATFRYKVVLDIEKNGISLTQASIKYGVSAGRLSIWLKKYRQGGIEALSITKKRGRPPGMGRPKKVQKPETELERLRREVQELKTENALLKKVKALVEEREARLRAIGRGQSEN
jgi:transposase-like protein